MLQIVMLSGRLLTECVWFWKSWGIYLYGGQLVHLVKRDVVGGGGGEITVQLPQLLEIV